MNTNNTLTAPVTIKTRQDVYNLIKFFTAIVGAAFHPEDLVKNYTYTDENGETRPSFAPEIADRLQTLLDQADEFCKAKRVDICTIRLSNLMYALKGWDLDALNDEFSKILPRHYNDTDVTGASRGKYLAEKMNDPEGDQSLIINLNAWDELCSHHDGLRESGLNWWYGAQFVGYDTPADTYIGDGDEPALI